MLLLLLAQVQYSTAQLDPVKNFCRRFGHQTALIDRRLYVDGGMLNYGPLSQYPTNYSNTGLLYHDLDQRGPGNMPKLVAGALSKNATVPSVSGGTLWTDDINKRFYLFGGEYYQQPAAPPFVPQLVLWSYDVLNDRWDSLGPPTRANVGGVAYGAGVTISERGEGFYYGGWKSNSSVAGWSGPPLLSTGMVKYTMESNDWRNDTGPDSVGRAEGSMVFLPISDGGMLVYLGGVKQGNNSVVGQSMEEILLYDVLSSSWYKQNATGEIPQMRRKFCAGAAWAQDQSSYNIYIYGGAGMEPDTSGFDDVYILTIPSFQWIKMFPDDGNVTGPNPHHSLTCNVVDYAQMLVLGGTFPTSDTCDIPNSYGLHNLDMGKQNYEKAGWYIYESNITSYAVPDLVIQAVGGSGAGGAMKTVPENGFDNRDLRVLMTRKANLPTRTPTRAIPTATSGPENKPSYLSTGAIAGIAVGSAAVLAGILGSCWFIQRHRRRRLAENAASGTWSPQTANGGLGPRTPNSPPQHAPFIQRQPVELPVEPPPGVNYWLGPDGVRYELVTNPSFVATGSNTVMNESIAGTDTGTGTGMGTNYSNNEQQTKIDSEGRLWVQVFPSPRGGGSVISGAGSPGSGGGGGGGGLGLGLYATNGTAGTGHSPVASGGGGSPCTPRTPRTPRTPVGYSSSPQVGPPQELGAEPSREGDVGSQALREGSGWDAAHGRPRHHTYYHP